MKERILLKNINVFDVEDGTFRKSLNVLIDDDIIKEIGTTSKKGEESLTQIDCSGKYAVPGLFECHGHLNILTNEKKEFDESDKENFKGFLERGITQVRDVGGPLKYLKKLKQSISEGEFAGPEIFYAGPMLEKSPLTWEKSNDIFPGCTVAINTREDAKNIIQELSRNGASLVKTFYKFDVDVYKYLVDEAEKMGLPVTLDPGLAFFQSIPMEMAIDFGVRCFEHATAPWIVVLKADLKSEHDKLLAEKADKKARRDFYDKVFSLGMESISMTKFQRLIDKMMQNNVYFCPTLHVFKLGVEEQSEQLNKDEQKKRKTMYEALYPIGQFFIKEMSKRNVKILTGHDANNPEFTINEMLLLKGCGLSESQTIKGATIYPAEWLRITDKYGAISEDKKANILILNKNPLENIQNIRTTHLVLQNGKIVFSE